MSWTGCLLSQGNVGDAGSSAATALSSAAVAASAGAEKTKTMKAGAGRSSYVPEEALQDIADPGASAVHIWLQAIADSLQD